MTILAKFKYVKIIKSNEIMNKKKGRLRFKINL
jgi:hypothetical protein